MSDKPKTITLARVERTLAKVYADKYSGEADAATLRRVARELGVTLDTSKART